MERQATRCCVQCVVSWSVGKELADRTTLYAEERLETACVAVTSEFHGTVAGHHTALRW